ncbi:GNAT family N-acetyltransferase [Diaminobutyricibacter sp. McL0608]|uniref:GNAT family N-acetyltransferase n=1 Tax=Leifsonia sp. McL0608 TaxID=3143537 RepID=UPI0031F2EF94
MVEVRVADAHELDPASVRALYEAVGWSVYTKDPETLGRALAGSDALVAAVDGAELVGLARAVTDGATILYLQDVLVRPDHQRLGLGRSLVTALLDRYPGVRQKVLLTDDEAAQKAFYESLGFGDIREAHDGVLHAFVRFD